MNESKEREKDGEIDPKKEWVISGAFLKWQFVKISYYFNFQYILYMFIEVYILTHSFIIPPLFSTVFFLVIVVVVVVFVVVVVVVVVVIVVVVVVVTNICLCCLCCCSFMRALGIDD